MDNDTIYTYDERCFSEKRRRKEATKKMTENCKGNEKNHTHRQPLVFSQSAAIDFLSLH